MDTERTLQIVLKYITDQAALGKAATGAQNIKRALRDVEQQAEQTRRQVQRLRETAEKFQSLGLSLTVIGGGILKAYQAAARGYIQAAGYTEQTAARWLSTTGNVERAQVRLGRVAAEALQPYYTMLAKVINRIADIGESNPKLAKGLLAGGLTVAGIGALSMLLGQGIRLYTDIKFISASALMNTAADKMLLAAGVNSKAASAQTGGSIISKLTKLLTTTIIPGSGAGVAMDARLAMALGRSTPTLAGIPLTGTMGVTMGSMTAAAGSVGGLLSGLAGFALGNSIYDQIAKNTGRADSKTIWSQLATVAMAYSGGSLGGIMGGAMSLVKGGGLGDFFSGYKTGSDIGFEEFYYGVGELTGLFTKAEVATRNLAKGTQEYYAALVENSPAKAQLIQEFMSYTKQTEQARKQHEQQETEIVEQYADQRAQITENYERDRTRMIRDFAQSQADAWEEFTRSQERQARDFQQSEQQFEDEYYRSRAEAARAYGLEVQRAEEDHQRQMHRLAEDHNERMGTLADARDALGMVREMRSYERQRQEAEEDYQVEARRRSQDYALRLAEQEEQFRRERQQRLAEYEQTLADQKADMERRRALEQRDQALRLADLDANHAAQMALLDEQEAETLAKLDEAYAEQVKTMEASFLDRIRALDPVVLGDYDTYLKQLETISTEFQTWLRDHMHLTTGSSTGQSRPGRAAGGYAGYGTYTLGERGVEFVLNDRTTRSAEQIVQGRLTQANLLAALAGGGKNIHITLQAGGLSLSETRRMIRDGNNELLAGLAAALGG